MTTSFCDCQVLVVGAGPTGLVLAAQLLARGIDTAIPYTVDENGACKMVHGLDIDPSANKLEISVPTGSISTRLRTRSGCSMAKRKATAPP